MGGQQGHAGRENDFLDWVSGTSQEAADMREKGVAIDKMSGGKTTEQWNEYYAKTKSDAEALAKRLQTPDATDKLLAATRTNAYERLKIGKNRQSSMTTTGKLGGFDVAKPVLRGY